MEDGEGIECSLLSSNSTSENSVGTLNTSSMLTAEGPVSTRLRDSAASCDGGTVQPPEEGRQRRRKCRLSKSSECPVCGITLRAGEINTHFAFEIGKLARLPQSRPLSQRTPSASSAAADNEPGPSTSSASSSSWSDHGGSNSATSKLRSRSHRKGAEWSKYESIRSNRQNRARQKRRRGESSPEEFDEDDLSGGRECPVCDKPFPTTEITRHIERCLRQAETEFEDEEVDIEGEDDEGEYEEYEWCGVTRVRATTLLRAEGQLHAIGTKVERGSEDEMVDVCDDDGQSFGPSQYTDVDLVSEENTSYSHREDDNPQNNTTEEPLLGNALSPCPSSSSNHADGNDNLISSCGRQQSEGHTSTGNFADVADGVSSSFSPVEESDTSSSFPRPQGDLSCNFGGQSPVGNDVSSVETPSFTAGLLSCNASSNEDIHNTNNSNNGNTSGADVSRKRSVSADGGVGGGGAGGGGGAVVEALRARVRELEEDRHKWRYTCRVCHGEYDKPVVSIACWHVHCETCWLQALAAKKLCPQCSVITTTSDLRRVYL